MAPSLNRWATAHVDLDREHSEALKSLQSFFGDVQAPVVRHAIVELHAKVKAATTAEAKLGLLESFAAAKAGA